MSDSSLTLDTSAALALADEISTWLRDRFAAAGVDRFVLGLSGGIDSAVVAGLCARAVGGDKVLGIVMPSASQPDDAAQARKVAEAFGIRVMEIDLTPVADAVFEAMPESDTIYQEILGEHAPEGENDRLSMARANVRPRSRMMTNYYVANLTRGIVVGTGNKTEYLIGYFTKYGDGGVDLAPLVDLYKYEVRAVATAIGVPQSVISRPPSAGLWEGQTDEDEIGVTYADLDRALIAIEGGGTSEIDAELLDRVARMIRTTDHKRSPVPAFRRGE